MMNYPKYESYKDSGIDWIGKIPSDWELAPLRKIFSFRNEKNDPVITDNILSLSIAHGVTEYSDEGRGGNKRKDDLSAYKIARPNDIVINSMNVIVGAVGLSKYFGAISPVYYAMYARNRSYSEYFYEYIFRNEGFQRGLLRLGKGILIKISDSGKMNTIRMKISQDDLKVLKLPLPSIQEQNLIAKFLDQKTTQLDEAISIKEKQIELLKEQKQVMIQNAVTKGLDPNVKMKDSGVDWIGKIPEHWSVLPGFTIFKENKDSNKGMKRDTVLSLSYGNIIIKPEEKLVGLVPESFETYQLVNSGDIIIRCTDLQNDKTSLRTGIARDNGIITSAYINLRVVNSSNKDYVHEFLHVFDITKAIYKYGSGLRQNLTFKDFKYLSILQPSIKEQNEIVEFLAAISKNIEDYNELLQQQISKLKEYKSILINSAVTGKIKVTPEMVGEA